MGYVIAAIVVLLIVAGFVTLLVLNSMRKGSAKAEDGGTPGVGQDETPLGDSTEHAGSHGDSGETIDDPEDGEGPTRPERPEDRQLRDAGARD
jgi:hypothetical protein